MPTGLWVCARIQGFLFRGDHTHCISWQVFVDKGKKIPLLINSPSEANRRFVGDPLFLLSWSLEPNTPWPSPRTYLGPSENLPLSWSPILASSALRIPIPPRNDDLQEPL